MGDEHGRLQFVGAGGAATLARAVAEFERLAERTESNGGDFLTAVAAEIEATRAKLEDCLRGCDSFDTLAFLRVAIGPWDYGWPRPRRRGSGGWLLRWQLPGSGGG